MSRNLLILSLTWVVDRRVGVVVENQVVYDSLGLCLVSTYDTYDAFLHNMQHMQHNIKTCVISHGISLFAADFWEQ